MNAEQRDNLLIRLDERVEAIRDSQTEFSKIATSPQGWARCQVHETKIEASKSTLKWAKRTFSVATLGLLGKVLYSTFWGGS